ncbi:YxeA family protein [Heyndrickxia sp. NPDC080065]|uniref:YxeA family protein n=1 Tax=Heyndrickxia sp. NPDC080065 TaxID=3390568 RepID=UPI003D080356
MKKLIIPGIIIVLIAGFILFIQNVNINRLGADNYYVQIKGTGEKIEDKSDNGEIYVSYKYTLPAYDKNGNEKKFTFTSLKQLREDAYLNLFVKDKKGVTSYQEVKLNEIPDKAKEKLK